MNAKTVVALGLVHVLIGCAPQAEWKKENASQAEFQRDHGECHELYKRNVLLAGLVISGVEFEKCMNAKGWTGTYKEQPRP